MTANRELRVEVFDDEIIVTLSSSRYSVTYFKPENSSGLIGKRIAEKDDPHAAMSVS
jgi:hypothetical protein